MSSLAKLLRVDARLGRQHALDERLLAHLEREERHLLVLLDGGVLRDVERECRLAHRRARRHDDEIRRLKAGGQLIEVAEAAGDARDGLAARMNGLDALHRGPQQLLDAREPLVRALLRHLKDLLLGDVEQLVRRGATAERLTDDLSGDFDETPEQRLFLHDLRVVLDVGSGGHGVHEEADVVLAARSLEIAASLQLVRERQRVDDAAALGDPHHGAKQTPVALGVEHRVVNDLHGAHHRILIHQHGGEHGLLGVLRVGRTPVAVGITPRGRRRYRVFGGRAGHLPTRGVSRRGSAAAPRDDRSQRAEHRNSDVPARATGQL